MLLYNKFYQFLLSNKKVILFILCSLFGGLLSIVFQQDTNWDLRNYHFYNPYAFFNNRLLFDFAPAMIQSYNNPAIDFLNYWMIQNCKPIYVGFILGCIQGVNIFIFYLIAEKVVLSVTIAFENWIVLFACVMGFYGVANIAEIGTTFGDNIVSVFVLAGLYFLINQLLERYNQKEVKVSRNVLLMSGLVMGFGVGLKLTIAIYPIALVLSLAWIAKNFKEYIQISFTYSVSVFVGFMASIGYWMYTLWINFGNPLYPYFNKYFKSPYCNYNNFTDKRFLPKDIFQTLFYPYYFIKKQNYTSELLFKDPHLAICYTALICLLLFVFYKLFSKKKSELFSSPNYKIYLFFISFYVISYILWQKTFSIYRYIVVLEILSPIFVLVILDLLSFQKKVKGVLFVVICIITVCNIERMDWGRLPWSDSYFGVELPKVANLEKANIVLAGGEPIAYIVPFFPKTTRFLRIHGNFIKTKDTTLYQQKLQQQIRSSSFNYLLMHHLKVVDIKAIEEVLGLKVDSSACAVFQTRIDKDLCLCALVKK